MRRRWFLAAIGAALLAASGLAASARAASEFDHRVALVIGNADYQYVPHLGNPANDARLIAQTLRGVGFDIIGGGAQINLDKSAMEKAIRDFGRHLTVRTVGLFYYAGHGLQIRSENYLVPVGGNPASAGDVDFELVNVNVILRQMADSGSTLDLMILDASRANPFGGRSFRDAAPGLALMQAPRGTVIVYAAQPGSVEIEGDGANSPFTRALAAAMIKPGLDVLSVFNDVGVAVDLATKHEQQPWTSSTPIEGKFVFAAVEAERKPAPALNPSPEVKPRQPVSGNTSQQVEMAYWETIKDSRDPADFEAYLKRYPDGTFVDLARNRIAMLSQQKTAVVQPPQPPAAKPPANAPNNDMVTIHATFMRVAPDEAARFVVRLNQGEHVTVTGKAGDDWYAVMARGNLHGYVWVSTVKPAAAEKAQNDYASPPLTTAMKKTDTNDTVAAAAAPPAEPRNPADMIDMIKRRAEEAAARARAEADEAVTANERGEAAAARARQEAQHARQNAPGHYVGPVYRDGVKSNDRFEGEVSNNAWNGCGIFFFADGGRYEGEWKNGQRNGYGVNYWANGERSSGQERDDKRNGYGVNVLPNGSTYKGHWENDDRNGYGVLPWSDGRYEGEFRDGWAEGYGVGTYTDGRRYEGQFTHGNWNGRGVLIQADGSVQAGMFSGGYYSGPFTTAQQ